MNKKKCKMCGKQGVTLNQENITGKLFNNSGSLIRRQLQKSRNIAMDKLICKAFSLEANAIIGKLLDYEVVFGNMIGVLVIGTAVKVET